MKASMVGTVIERYGKQWVITGYHWGFEMFEVVELGRRFRTLVPKEEC